MVAATNSRIDLCTIPLAFVYAICLTIAINIGICGSAGAGIRKTRAIIIAIRYTVAIRVDVRYITTADPWQNLARVNWTSIYTIISAIDVSINIGHPTSTCCPKALQDTG
jgi:hypothetical protein